MPTNNSQPADNQQALSQRDSLSAAIAEARAAQRMTFRAFAAELGVSHNSIKQWETGIAAPNAERLTAWTSDERAWVRALAYKLLAIKHGPALALLAHAPAPDATAA